MSQDFRRFLESRDSVQATKPVGPAVTEPVRQGHAVAAPVAQQPVIRLPTLSPRRDHSPLAASTSRPFADRPNTLHPPGRDVTQPSHQAGLVGETSGALEPVTARVRTDAQAVPEKPVLRLPPSSGGGLASRQSHPKASGSRLSPVAADNVDDRNPLNVSMRLDAQEQLDLERILRRSSVGYDDEPSGSDYSATRQERQDLKKRQKRLRRRSRGEPSPSQSSSPTDSSSDSSEQEETLRQPQPKSSRAVKKLSSTISATARGKRKARTQSPPPSSASEHDDASGTSSSHRRPGRIPPEAVRQFKDFGSETRRKAEQLAEATEYSLATVMQVAGLTARSARKINISNAFRIVYSDNSREKARESGDNGKI